MTQFSIFIVNLYSHLLDKAMKDWYDHFIEILHKKFPTKSQLTAALVDLLSLERESVYRRLRKEIVFTSHEIGTIASAWNISMDETLGTSSSKVMFLMHPIDYLTPSDADMDFLRQRGQWIEQLDDAPNSEYIVVCNNLSRSFSAGFSNLYKFNIFKWAYQYCNAHNKDSNMTFAETVIPEKVLEEVVIYYKRMKHIKNTTYILDSMIFDSFVREIQYFHSIFLITDEEKKTLKEELHALLDYLSEVAKTGCFPETKNKVTLYVSILNINTNYSYFYDEKIETFRIHAFNMFDSITNDSEMVGNFKEWIQKKRKTSVQISEVDERSRIQFFMKQRSLVDSL